VGFKYLLCLLNGDTASDSTEDRVERSGTFDNAHDLFFETARRRIYRFCFPQGILAQHPLKRLV
jgi:hypothetical protein